MNEDLENVLKHMPNGILLIDETANQVTFANDSFCSLVFCNDQDERCLNRKIRQPLFTKYDISETDPSFSPK
jgi:uncharacterized protein YwgA